MPDLHFAFAFHDDGAARHTDEIAAHELNGGAPPANQRIVISLRDIEGWTSEEVCRFLDISESNQRVLMHRAWSRVRSALAQHMA